MEASHRKLSAAVVLLLLTVATEMGPAQAKECFKQSTTFKGLCLSSRECNDSCLLETSDYSGGKCHGLRLKCLCITQCKTTLLAPAPMAAPMD